jgi:hypothetical protein
MERPAREPIAASRPEHGRRQAVLVLGQQSDGGRHAADRSGEFGEEFGCYPGAEPVKVFRATLQAAGGKGVEHGMVPHAGRAGNLASDALQKGAPYLKTLPPVPSLGPAVVLSGQMLGCGLGRSPPYRASRGRGDGLGGTVRVGISIVPGFDRGPSIENRATDADVFRTITSFAPLARSPTSDPVLGAEVLIRDDFVELTPEIAATTENRCGQKFRRGHPCNSAK